MPARLLHGGDVITVDETFSRHTAVAIEGGRIAAVGALAELAPRFADAERVDLRGRSVVPGFVDAHHHLLIAAIYGSAVDVHPSATPTLDAIQAAIRARAATTDAHTGEGPAWIVGLGYDQWKLARQRHPDRADLDAACSDRPVLLIHFSFHQGVANSRALELAGIDEHTPDPPGGVIERDRKGRLTGRLFEAPLSILEAMARKSLLGQVGGDVFGSIGEYQRRVLACGITRICDPTVPASLRPLYAEASQRGALKLPVVMMPVSEKGYLVQPWELLEEAPPGEGSEQLRAGPLKLFFDGGERCAICLSPAQALGSMLSAARLAVRERTLSPLRNIRSSTPRRGGDGRLHSGILFYSGTDANEVVGRAVERGYAVAIHAFGNEAIDQALTAIGKVRKRHTDVPPPRIEHAAILDDGLIARAADLGVQIVTQPAFLFPLGSAHAPEMPGLRLLPLRSLADRGVRVASSSDGPMAFDPLLALRAAVTRRATPQRTIHEDEGIAPEAWLRMATVEGARAAASLDVAGSIEAGKRADLVVLSGDPTNPAELDDLGVEATLLAGELVHGSF